MCLGKDPLPWGERTLSFAPVTTFASCWAKGLQGSVLFTLSALCVCVRAALTASSCVVKDMSKAFGQTVVEMGTPCSSSDKAINECRLVFAMCS